MTDPNAQAAPEQESVTFNLKSFNGTLSTGRPFMLALVEDMTDSEFAELGGFLLTTVLSIFQTARTQAASGLVVAKQMPVKREA